MSSGGGGSQISKTRIMHKKRKKIELVLSMAYWKSLKYGVLDVFCLFICRGSCRPKKALIYSIENAPATLAYSVLL
jgi:hypothetical protein